MNDRRIAELLDVDAPFVAEAAGAVVPRRRRPSLAVLSAGVEGQEARILELIDALGRRIRRHPLAALAIGAGVGFVVGGALSFRAGRILLAAGARRAARELLKQLL
jgi:hypothetical protein